MGRLNEVEVSKILAGRLNSRFYIDRDNHWIWTWGTFYTPNGKKTYGQISYKDHPYKAHRLMYFLYNPDSDTSKQVLHRCGISLCINPDSRHLYLGDHSDNMQDRLRHGTNPDFKGEKHPRAKLTEDQVKLIRSLEFRDSSKYVAALFEVDRKTIENIWSRKSWAHF